MREHLFGVSLRPSAAPPQDVTNIAVPPTSSVPVYCIHSFEQPFCANVHCSCHTHEQNVARLFVTLIEGRLELEPAAALLTPQNRREGRTLDAAL